jgi:hypothetical protein
VYHIVGANLKIFVLSLLCFSIVIFYQACGEHDSSGPEQVEETDLDGDGVFSAQDCDLNDPSKFRIVDLLIDNDEDGFGVGEVLKNCIGNQIPSGFIEFSTDIDCDDENDSLSQKITFFVDSDEDGYGTGEGEAFCMTTPPNGFAISDDDPNDQDTTITPADSDGDGVANSGDCAPDDPSKYQISPARFVDADGDGFYMGWMEIRQVCTDNMLSGYKYDRNWKKIDCDDNDPSITANIFYRDADSDGFGWGARSYSCDSIPPEGYVNNNHDCYRDDPELGNYVEKAGEMKRYKYNFVGGQQDCDSDELSFSIYRTCENGVFSPYISYDEELYPQNSCTSFEDKVATYIFESKSFSGGSPPIINPPDITLKCPFSSYADNLAQTAKLYKDDQLIGIYNKAPEDPEITGTCEQELTRSVSSTPGGGQNFIYYANLLPTKCELKCSVSNVGE